MNFNYLDNITRCAKDALEKPQDFGYWGNDSMFITWGFCGIDKNRDSKILEQSNFEVITRSLMREFPNDFDIERYNHWAVGWVERLTVKVLKSPGEITEENITEAFKKAMWWKDELNDYPCASEDHYEDLRYENELEFIQELPKEFIEKIDLDATDWADRILWELRNVCEIDIDADIYPKDSYIYQAIFDLNIIKKDEDDSYNSWNKFCEENGYEDLIMTTEKMLQRNPNQLTLFGGKEWMNN